LPSPTLPAPVVPEPQQQPVEPTESAPSSPSPLSKPQIPGARPLICETAEVPMCGVWIPRRVVFRRGRRRLSSAVLSLMHEPSMNHLALSVTTEIEFEDADVKKQSSAASATTTTTTVEVGGPQSESGSGEESVSEAPSSEKQLKKRPQVAETVEDTVPVVFARRTRFHKGKPKRASSSKSKQLQPQSQQRASMY
jgi:hypothetical protein